MDYIRSAWGNFAFESILVNIRTTVGYFEYFEVCSEYFIVYWEYFVSTLEYIGCILGYLGYFGSACIAFASIFVIIRSTLGYFGSTLGYVGSTLDYTGSFWGKVEYLNVCWAYLCITKISMPTIFAWRKKK